MKLKKIAKNFLPPIIYRAIWKPVVPPPVVIDDGGLAKFLANEKVPFSEGFYTYRTQYLSGLMKDEALLATFLSDQPLPAGHGIGIDERSVEYPWLVTRLHGGKGALLDAGSALNHSYVLDHPAVSEKNVHILTLAPEYESFWQRGISYLFGDLRDIPIRSNYYDVIASISTLEHIGCDNTVFTQRTGDGETEGLGDQQAARELLRVLKPGGWLYISVPFGVRANHGFQWVYDTAMLDALLASLGKAAAIQKTFYRYTASGWQHATMQECLDCVYVEWIAKTWGTGVWPNPIPLEPDRAAAARAVACIAWQKPLA